MFGLMTVTMGLIHSYGGLLTVRFFLGAFESGMFPGCFYLLSCWYSRAYVFKIYLHKRGKRPVYYILTDRNSEAQKRYSFFFSSTTLAGAFGGLLAAGIGESLSILFFARQLKHLTNHTAQF